MSFRQLYEAVQSQTGRISTKWLKQKAIEFSTITAVKEQWSSVIDDTNLRGFYIEGPMGPPVPLQPNEALIVLSRAMVTGQLGPHYRRFVYTKELMHVFDQEHEKADNPETLDRQIEKFSDPTAEMSHQYRAETKAVWRALAVLCQEDQRQDYKRQLEANQVSLEVIASGLHLPPAYVRNLFRDGYEQFLQHVLAD